MITKDTGTPRVQAISQLETIDSGARPSRKKKAQATARAFALSVGADPQTYQRLRSRRDDIGWNATPTCASQ